MRSLILIVEDNVVLREIMSRTLHGDSYEIRAVPNGTEALAFLATNASVSLVILDLMMPCVSGWEILAKLRSHPYLARVPVIIVSGLAPPPSGIDAQAYLQKPFRPEALLRMAQSLIRSETKASSQN